MKEKKYWLENLFDLESIAKILSIFPKTLGSDVNIFFKEDGKEYNITKTDDKIEFKCNDGRHLIISAHTSRVNGEFGGSYNLTSVVVKYRLFESVIELYKGMEHTVLTDLEDFEAYKMAKTDFCHFATIKSGYIRFFSEFTNNSIDDYKFTKDGIKYGDYLISEDCEKVISKGGKILPSKEEIDNFSLENEKANYNKLVNSSKLDSRVKEELINNFNIDDLLKEYQELQELYNDKLPSLKPAIGFQRALVDGSIEDYLFNINELGLFINKLTEALKDKITEYDDVEILEEARKLVKAISSKGMEALKKIMDEIQ